ncbi:MAG: hypothetical protein LBR93_05085 [Treponema sp.]|jgi:hypothetical protein|nr:hypothetical protein [Treponema sp.]
MREFSETMLEKMLDYYGNFAGDPRILSMIDAADRFAGSTGAFRALEEDELDIAAAGDAAVLPEKPEDL